MMMMMLGVNERSLQVIDIEVIGKLPTSITLRYLQ